MYNSFHYDVAGSHQDDQSNVTVVAVVVTIIIVVVAIIATIVAVTVRMCIKTKTKRLNSLCKDTSEHYKGRGTITITAQLLATRIITGIISMYI